MRPVFPVGEVLDADNHIRFPEYRIRGVFDDSANGVFPVDNLADGDRLAPEQVGERPGNDGVRGIVQGCRIPRLELGREYVEKVSTDHALLYMVFSSVNVDGALFF